MATAAELLLRIKAENKAKEEMAAFGRQMDGLANQAKLAAVGFGVTLVGGLVASIRAAAEAQQVQAQLDAVLKSTGGAAGVTAAEVNKLSSELQKVTTFGDEAITSAQSMLLTFTNISREVFPQATEAVLDMSTALGQDLQQSAIQLGKALNDPIGGVTALRRVGIQLTDAQEVLIKKMVEAGDVMGAQKVILQELQTEFGGSARAAGETFGGQLAQLQNVIGDLGEQIGNLFLPLLTELTTFLTTQVQAIQANESEWAAWGRHIGEWFKFVVATGHWMADDIGITFDQLGWRLRSITEVIQATIQQMQALGRLANMDFEGFQHFSELASQAKSRHEAIERIIGAIGGERSPFPAFPGLTPRAISDEETEALGPGPPIARSAIRRVAGGGAGGESEAARRRREAEEARIERLTLTPEKLMGRAFPATGTSRFMAGFEFFPPETLATLGDWDRQMKEFAADSKVLVAEMDRLGTFGSPEAVAGIKAIITAMEALPSELQEGLPELKATLARSLDEFQLTADGMVDMARRNKEANLAIQREWAEEQKRIADDVVRNYIAAEDLKAQKDFQKGLSPTSKNLAERFGLIGLAPEYRAGLIEQLDMEAEARRGLIQNLREQDKREKERERARRFAETHAGLSEAQYRQMIRLEAGRLRRGGFVSTDEFNASDEAQRLVDERLGLRRPDINTLADILLNILDELRLGHVINMDGHQVGRSQARSGTLGARLGLRG